MPTLMLVAGEPSGDLHAARVAAAVKGLQSDVLLLGMGGDLMEAAGVELIYHIRDSAVVGIAEAITAIPTFLKKRKHLKQIIRERKPDALLLVDFAEFNMPLAKFAHQLQIPAIYYIPPKAWAWRPRRAEQIAKTTQCVASIFPFETEFYQRAGANAHFVGHPLLDFAQTPLSVEEAQAQLNLCNNTPVVGLMPGSRRREVERLLPVMLEVADRLRDTVPDCQFILPLAPSLDRASLPEMPGIKIVVGRTYEAMRASDLMLIASGTATLEATCLGTPMVILYKMSHLSWLVLRRLVKLERSGLPNIIAGHEIVPELLQSEVQTDRITEIALNLLHHTAQRESQRAELRKVYEQLGTPGAAERVAQLILSNF